MNKKAEQFKKFLDERKITAFQMEEIADDPQNTVAFRSFIAVEGQQLPTMLIVDDSVFSIIRVQIAPQVLKEDNADALLKLANTQNMAYKPFKLFFDGSGDLILDTCIVAENDGLEGEAVYRMFNVIIGYLNDNYRNIMKAVWR